ncbi:hypothetical protein C1H46_030046 [Malus baccata]|uniref:Uncharacterized protein n=1 Tax=Malus baccata TaxID=106549 RepID=A0A540LD48_MALBA|nr:hypothetical protein C1H46_030046 [Malus baccata]
MDPRLVNLVDLVGPRISKRRRHRPLQWHCPLASSVLTTAPIRLTRPALTEEVADLRSKLASYKSQMSLIVEALIESGIRLSDIRSQSTSKPLQPEHAITPPLRPLSPSSSPRPSCPKISSRLRAMTP